MACLEDFEVLGTLGKGTFGTVSTIRRKLDDKILVWKELDYGKMSEKEKQQLVQEVNLLQKLKHPHIVRYYDRIIDKDNTTLLIIMEYCEGGDLASLIKKCRKERTFMDEEVIWQILLQVASALAECHGSQFSESNKEKLDTILHRDIKPGNIFLDAQCNAKLGDFGLARVLGKDSLYAHTYVGTPYYMSPEQIAGSPYNEKCEFNIIDVYKLGDIWSLGCVIFEMCSLQ